MAVETLILEALQEDEAVSAMLARWNGSSAVFYQMAPPDTDGGWTEVQYPRVDFVTDWTYNPERQADGACQINVWCLNNGSTEAPEDVGEAVRECLRDLFLTDEDGEVYALEWQRMDAFEAGGQEGEPLTVGVTLSFDILAFPVQITTEPDPVAGLLDYIKARMPQALVVGLDQLPKLCRPTAEHPILYVRLSGDGSAMRNSWAVAWMDVTLPVHVFAPGSNLRQTLSRTLCNAMSLDGECKLRDGSPMLFRRVALSLSANPLRQGQLTLTGRYGVPWVPPEVPKLNHPHMKGEFRYDKSKEFQDGRS